MAWQNLREELGSLFDELTTRTAQMEDTISRIVARKREEHRVAMALWRAQNPKAARELWQRAEATRDKKARAAYKKDWKARNPDKVQAQRAKDKAKAKAKAKAKRRVTG